MTDADEREFTHTVALSRRTTTCGRPLTAEQLARVAPGRRLYRLVPPTCPDCLAAENRSGTTPWYAKAIR